VTALRAVGAWTSPVLLASLASFVFAGDRAAPLMVLIVLIAPLVALLRPSLAPPPRVIGGVTVVAVAVIVCADFNVIAELARFGGIDRWYALVVALAVALVPAFARDVEVWWSRAVPIGLAACTLPLVAVAVATNATPWSAWSSVASRPAFEFGEHSEWVTDGRSLWTEGTLTFTEPHRMTAVTPGTYRVLERDGSRAIAREWHLASGDVLALRPGDRLVLARGVRVRFEPGKRVPGSAMSGATWADPPPARRMVTVLEFLGATATLLGGGMALMSSPVSMTVLVALGVSVTLLVVVLAPLCWGVYAMYAAPDLLLGATILTPLVQLSPTVDPHDGALLAGSVAFGLVTFFAATMAALSRRLEVITNLSPGRARAAWSGLCVGACVASLWPADPWRLLLAGLGLLASAWIAPALADAGAVATIVAGVVGTIAFAIIALGGTWLIHDVPVVLEYPALVAAPVAWCVARVASRWDPAG
jgi:hypothetical protein